MVNMSELLDLISNNALISSVVAAAILGIVAWVWKARTDKKDSDTIYNFLLTSKYSMQYTFRNTEAIASHTKLSEERVAALCSNHPKIRRNEKEKQSWCLAE
jgi:hypothetical protein